MNKAIKNEEIAEADEKNSSPHIYYFISSMCFALLVAASLVSAVVMLTDIF